MSKSRQTPGRAEALREVMRDGIANATPELLNLAGFNRPVMRKPASQSLPGIMLSSGIEQLTSQERAALPF